MPKYNKKKEKRDSRKISPYDKSIYYKRFPEKYEKIKILYNVDEKYKVFRMFPQNEYDPIRFLKRNIPEIEDKLKQELQNFNFKLQLSIEVKFINPSNKDVKIAHFHSKQQIIYSEIDIDLEKQIDYFREKIERFTKGGSGLEIMGTNELLIKTTKYTPISSGCSVELPKSIQNKKCVLNIKNKDNKCILFCITAHLFPVEKNGDRPTKYDTNLIKCEGVSFPTPLNDIPKLEKQNAL